MRGQPRRALPTAKGGSLKVIDAEKVVSQLALLAGLEPEEAQRWLPLCQGAAAWITGRLRPGADVAANEQALVLAAAGLANLQRELAGGGQPGLRVADIQIAAQSGGAKPARALYDQLMAQAAHCLIPETAPLLGVEAL